MTVAERSPPDKGLCWGAYFLLQAPDAGARTFRRPGDGRRNEAQAGVAGWRALRAMKNLPMASTNRAPITANRYFQYFSGGT